MRGDVVKSETASAGAGASASGAAGGGKRFVPSETMLSLLRGEWIPTKVSAEQIRSFLAKHGETSYNLIAAYEVSEDQQWLKRALELHPNDAAVLFVAVGAKPGEPELAALIERWKAADPLSPLPFIFDSARLFDLEDGKSARTALREAVVRPGFYTYSSERIAAKRLFYEDTGLSPVEAEVAATWTLNVAYLSIALVVSKGLIPTADPKAEVPAPPPSLEDLRLAYDLARTFATPGVSRLLLNQIVSNAVETRVLLAVPADAPLGFLPVDPAQRLVELAKQKAEIQFFRTPG